jgi:hypothetical protein
MSDSPANPKEVAINGERIETFTLLRALCRISDRHWSIDQIGYEEEEWQAAAMTGSINDREYKQVATAGSLIKLLKALGKEKFNG